MLLVLAQTTQCPLQCKETVTNLATTANGVMWTTVDYTVRHVGYQQHRPVTSHLIEIFKSDHLRPDQLCRFNELKEPSHRHNTSEVSVEPTAKSGLPNMPKFAIGFWDIYDLVLGAWSGYSKVCQHFIDACVVVQRGTQIRRSCHT